MESRKGPMPFLVAMLIADMAIREEGSKKFSLIGIFETIMGRAFPYTHPALTVYVKLTDAQGMYDFQLELIHLDGAERIAKVPFGAEAPSRLATGELVLTMKGVRFPTPGLYEFRLSADGRHVGSKTIQVEQAPSGGGQE